jgi:anti-repressor protein
MATNLKLFENESFGVIRTAGTSEEPLFCLADICNAVDIANPSNVKNRLDEDDLHLMEVIDNMGRTQKAYFVSEAGMYDAILKSESKKARPFSRWITHDVLPSIRKTGSYSVKPKREPSLMQQMKF